MNQQENEKDRERAAQKQRGELTPGGQKRGGEKQQMVRLNNKRATVLHLPSTPAEASEHQKRMMQTQPGMQQQQGMPQPLVLTPGKALAPGGNNVPAEEWQRAKENPTVQMWIEEGWLEEGDQADAGKPEGPTPPSSLRDRNPEAARMLIDAESNGETLDMWHRSERRDDVKQMIQQRRQALGHKSE